jgi:type IV pilus modification protein PilV
MNGKHLVASEQGFSLLEVLIAVTILTIGLLGVLMFQITAIKGNALANEAVTATYFAQEQIEIFQRTTFGSINSSTGVDTSLHQPIYADLPALTDNAAMSKPIKSGKHIYRVWEVVHTPLTSSTLKTITVWGCWADEKGKWHSVQLVTRKGNVS